MPKGRKKTYLNTTISTDLLKRMKILAIEEEVRLNQLLEEAMIDLLDKYKDKNTDYAAKKD